MLRHKVGDIVTCSRGGWWKVVAIDPLIKGKIILELALDNKGNVPKNARRLSMPDHWCTLVLVSKVKQQREQDLKKYNNLLFIIDPTSGIDDSILDEKLKDTTSSEPKYLTTLDPPVSLQKK